MQKPSADLLPNRRSLHTVQPPTILQATDEDRKVEICTRSYEILVRDAGLDPSDVIFDPNILTVATGLLEHANYAVDFINATRRIKSKKTRSFVK
ncbi:hypothetical protein HPB51_022702 [Rhipicephalus microplus]|uniref:Pterin-binding domain-containing protein n=1 Tax=Rhipicephalus microplus TaxID=6941 RepID=A0A9J6E415_RHIMP|nr:hypothetical protein HPB51_022702 [Rhipicephalus microplus]